MFIKILNLALGGTIGTIARYALGGAVHKTVGKGFPYGTMAVNLIGCFIIGFLVSFSENKFAQDPNARTLLIVGFCGAFTTFSSLILETNNLIKEGSNMAAFLNIALSVALGFLVFRAGVLLGEMV